MDVLAELSVIHNFRFKRNLLIALWGLTLISATAQANTHCPDLSINAVCVNGAWKVSITPASNWEFMGDSVNEKKCVNNEQTNDVRWNYAFASARMGIVGCNYKLFDNRLNQIGLIQIKSTQYVRTGNNWEKESYPGNWTCHESQKTCLFR